MVMTAQSAATRRMEKIMTAYTISEQNEIVAHAHAGRGRRQQRNAL
jgi:hypothetical protein